MNGNTSEFPQILNLYEEHKGALSFLERPSNHIKRMFGPYSRYLDDPVNKKVYVFSMTSSAEEAVPYFFSASRDNFREVYFDPDYTFR
jgi:hypothetical protein